MQVLSISVGYLPHLFGLKKNPGSCYFYFQCSTLGGHVQCYLPTYVGTDWHRGRQIQDLLNGTGVMRNVVESYLEEQHSYFYVFLESESGTCPGFLKIPFHFRTL